MDDGGTGHQWVVGASCDGWSQISDRATRPVNDVMRRSRCVRQAWVCGPDIARSNAPQVSPASLKIASRQRVAVDVVCGPAAEDVFDSLLLVQEGNALAVKVLENVPAITHDRIPMPQQVADDGVALRVVVVEDGLMGGVA